jgi:hypothetical protein
VVNDIAVLADTDAEAETVLTPSGYFGSAAWCR